MLQAILKEKKVIDYRQVDLPEPQKNQVLIKVKNIGICGSDIHAYHDAHPFISLPIVQGHEVTGVIEKLGADVNTFSKGDRVVIRPQRFCRKCRACRDGQYNICENIEVLGCLSTGAASEYYAVEESIVYKLPDNINLDAGTLIEPLAVAIHAIKRGGGVENKNVLVLGAGTIGNLVGQAANAMGAKSVMITDVSDYRLRLAENCGLHNGVNITNTNLNEVVINKFGVEKADIIFDCVALESTINEAIEIARKGTSIILVGVFGSLPKVDLGIVQDRELSLIGTLCYVHEDFKEAIQLATEGKVNLDNLITNVFPFNEYNEAYQYIDSSKDGFQKVVIKVND